jgi:hypothetical protein
LVFAVMAVATHGDHSQEDSEAESH